MNRIFFQIACLFCLGITALQAQDVERLAYRLDTSAITYNVSITPGAGIPLRRSEPLPDILCRRKVDGQTKTTYFRLHGEHDILFLKAEQDMDTLQFAAARQKYRSLLDSFPDDTYLMIRLGLSYEKEGNTSKALHWYKKAITKNDLAFDAHRRVAGILTENKADRKVALDHIIKASIMNRNDEKVEAMLEKVAQDNKSKYESWTFMPRTLYSIDPDGEVVSIDIHKKYWRGYALSQSAYLFDDSYKEEVIAQTPAQKTVTPYRVSLTLLYEAIRKKWFLKDPMLKTLKRAVKQDMIEEFLIYEIFLPLDAYHYFMLDEAQKERIYQYVKKIKLRIK